MSDDITTGELGRRMDTLTSTVTTSMTELRAAVDARPDWKDVQRVEEGIHAKIQAEKNELVAMVLSLTQRVAKSEAWGTWVGRTIGAGIIVALLAVLLSPKPLL